ncbi:MAG TPA: PIG-L family deacetylase, partial [Kofleriaceae bacterium]|nr:PIG-L family deacetylase [Kofleriaceae bacterium]
MTRALALCVLFACGDNTLPDGEPLGTAPELAIVAAPGDDLVFVEPELVESVQAGSGATVVYVTAGDEAGTRAAWAVAAGATTWRCGWIELADHAAEHCRLDAANLSLVFLGYPAGGADGSAPDSLLNLWEANIDRATTRGARPASYDQPGLIAAVAEAITDTQPQIVRTQEIAATHGDDDSDHMLVGALALLAHAAATSPAELLSYRGDNIAAEPADQLTALVEELGPIAGTLAADPAYLARRYAVGFRRAASGAMTLDGGATCLAPANDGGVVLGPCAGAPSWQLDPSGELRDPMNQCIALLPTGELVVGDCVGGATRRFYLDDDGVIWTAVPPAAVADMATSHLWCLAPGGGRVRAQLCGATRAPAWSFLGATVATPRATLGMTATGRAVRIADLDGDGLGDLCAV